MLDCLVNGVKSGLKYPQIVREFSLTLNYLSVRAYDFVRTIFNNNLPGRSTIQMWYANSDLDCTPGINSTSLRVLEQKAVEHKKNGKELICSLCFDEMSIRQHMQWCHSAKIMLGLPTAGEHLDQMGSAELAKQVIVYMCNVIDERYKIPVAFELLTSLNANHRVQLLKQVIDRLKNIDITIMNVAFDGLRANATMAKLLGANLDVTSADFRPYFFHGSGQKIFIFFDNCHMLKLVRNTLGDIGVLFNSNDEKIEWSYFQKLLEFGKTEGFACTHKMTKKHIEFRRNVMKVELAVQTLSASTAKSMSFLKERSIEEFRDVHPTVYYAQIFNDLFDVFNTKKIINQNPFKNSLCAENENTIFALFEEASNYIKGLRMINDKNKKIPIINSNRCTGFKGFIINMRSLELIYQEYVQERKVLASIPTYDLNQDHLEIFFGKIRSRNGNNDNPTAQQFTAAFSKLLANDSVSISKHANCISNGTSSRQISNILVVSSRSKSANKDDNMPSQPELEELFEQLESIENDEIDDPNNNSLQDCAIVAMAKDVEKILKSLDRVYCEECKGVFDRERKVSTTLATDEAPCLSTFEICKKADRFLKLKLLKGTVDFKTIPYAILESIEVEDLFNESDFNHQPDHKLFLIREIVEVFVQIKGSFLAKSSTLVSQKKFIRTAYRKQVHVLGQ